MSKKDLRELALKIEGGNYETIETIKEYINYKVNFFYETEKEITEAIEEEKIERTIKRIVKMSIWKLIFFNKKDKEENINIANKNINTLYNYAIEKIEGKVKEMSFKQKYNRPMLTEKIQYIVVNLEKEIRKEVKNKKNNKEYSKEKLKRIDEMLGLIKEMKTEKDLYLIRLKFYKDKLNKLY